MLRMLSARILFRSALSRRWLSASGAGEHPSPAGLWWAGSAPDHWLKRNARL